jgi:hypothetical protein
VSLAFEDFENLLNTDDFLFPFPSRKKESEGKIPFRITDTKQNPCTPAFGL